MRFPCLDQLDSSLAHHRKALIYGNECSYVRDIEMESVVITFVCFGYFRRKQNEIVKFVCMFPKQVNVRELSIPEYKNY